MPAVCFVTLSRSDYASLRPVVRAALKDSAIEVKLIAGGSHLLKRCGLTLQQIKKDGLPVHEQLEFLTETDDSPADFARAYARAVQAFVKSFTALTPQLVFVLGDRWEMLAVATAASMLQLPLVHHSGGDLTLGSADNQIRYAITSLSHLHLTALEEHRERLLLLGEESWRVLTVGEPALTELSAVAGSQVLIRSALGLKAGEPFVLATFHPASFEELAPERQIEVFLRALDSIPEQIVLTAPNPDPASALFFRAFKEYAGWNQRVHFFESLGAEQYYAAMAEAKYMIGNSSSGLWEAPSFGLPVVNLGTRQQGRAHGPNVLHAPLELAEISKAIKTAGDAVFRRKISGVANPYVKSDTLKLILDCLKQPRNRETLLAKRFIDPGTAGARRHKG